MKKVLALVLAAVMALSLTTAVSALEVKDDGSKPAPDTFADGDVFYFGGDTYEIPLTPGDDFEKATTATSDDNFLTLSQAEDGEGNIVTTEYALSASVSSSKPNMLKANIEIDTKKADAKKGTDGYEESKSLLLKLDPADEFFTVEEHEVEIKLVVVQKEKASNPTVDAKAEMKFTVKIRNEAHGEDDFWKNAEGNVESLKDLTKPVIEADVFTGIAKDKALTLDYSDYTIKFAKVSKQNTALYLKANTDVAEGSKAIASIGFKPTRVKDAATITMPINPDNENFYGETVYVYALVDGKPTGEAIEAEVVNHNSVIFTVPAGTTLGTFAAYGAKAEGEAEKPAIPETGANDIVNVAIVFSVVALAAAGFVAVKKVSK